MKKGIEIIAQARQNQFNEGHSIYHDSHRYKRDELVRAAVSYALPQEEITVVWGIKINRWFLWPWPLRFWKPTPEDRIKELGKAGALIAAEIDRLLYIENKKENHES